MCLCRWWRAFRTGVRVFDLVTSASRHCRSIDFTCFWDRCMSVYCHSNVCFWVYCMFLLFRFGILLVVRVRNERWKSTQIKRTDCFRRRLYFVWLNHFHRTIAQRFAFCVSTIVNYKLESFIYGNKTPKNFLAWFYLSKKFTVIFFLFVHEKQTNTYIHLHIT